MLSDTHIPSLTEKVITLPILQNVVSEVLHQVSVQSVICKATNSGFLPDKVGLNKRHLTVNCVNAEPLNQINSTPTTD